MNYKLYHNWHHIKVINSIEPRPYFTNDDRADLGTNRNLYTLISEEEAAFLKLKFPDVVLVPTNQIIL